MTNIRNLINTDSLADFKYLPMPEPPVPIIAACKERLEKKRWLVSGDFWREHEHSIFLDQVDKWRGQNKRGFHWLTEYRKDGKYSERHDEIDALLKEYNNHPEWVMYGLGFVREIASLPLLQRGAYV